MTATGRQGFSLVEMMVAMTITMLVFAITLPFVRAQTRTLGSTAGRLDADQVARFAMRAVEQDLRRAAGEYGQPTLVAAGPMLLVFNANLRQADSTDVRAMESEVVGHLLGAAWPVARADTLPLTTRSYPTVDYVGASGDTSRAETIAYFLIADTTVSSGDSYVLFRQSNDQAPTEIVDGVYLPSGSEFFTYYSAQPGSLTQLPETTLFWTDTLLATVQTIGLRASGAFFNKFDSTTTIRTIDTRLTLPVSLKTIAHACAGTPAAPTSSTAAALTSSGQRGVQLAWNKSTGDTGLPSGVRQYWIERRPSGGTWSRVGLTPALGDATYAWVDVRPFDSGTFEYGIVALGCGGVETARLSLGEVTL